MAKQPDDKRGVVYRPSFHEAIRCLEDMDRLKMYDAVMDYGLEDTPPDLPPHLKGLFALIKPVIDSSKSRYLTAQANGSKGGRPPINQNDNQNDNHDIDIDIDTDIDIFQKA